MAVVPSLSLSLDAAEPEVEASLWAREVPSEAPGIAPYAGLLNPEVSRRKGAVLVMGSERGNRSPEWWVELSSTVSLSGSEPLPLSLVVLAGTVARSDRSPRSRGGREGELWLVVETRGWRWSSGSVKEAEGSGVGPRPPAVGVGSGRSGNEWGSLGSNGAGSAELLAFAGEPWELCEPILSRYGGGVIGRERGGMAAWDEAGDCASF